MYEWFTRLRSGRQSIQDNLRQGRLSDNTHVQKIMDLVRANRRLTVRKLAEEVGMLNSYDWYVNNIFTQKLNICRTVELFVPRLMTAQQKENRGNVYLQIFEYIDMTKRS